jgi:hypothetical protein
MPRTPRDFKVPASTPLLATDEKTPKSLTARIPAFWHDVSFGFAAAAGEAAAVTTNAAPKSGAANLRIILFLLAGGLPRQPRAKRRLALDIIF